MIFELIGKGLGLIGGTVKRRQERKAAQQSAEAKLKQKRLDGDLAIEFSRSEWEALGKAAEGGTWKDEYVTIIFTLPIVMLLLGSVYTAFTGDTRLLEGVKDGIAALEALGLDYGEITYIIVLAAVGIKAIKTA